MMMHSADVCRARSARIGRAGYHQGTWPLACYVNGGRAVMAEAVSAVSTPKATRLDRRKARTRQALIDAAVQLIAEGRGDRASIQEITEEADIGFGWVYNNFDSKEQLFATASEEV